MPEPSAVQVERLNSLVRQLQQQQAETESRHQEEKAPPPTVHCSRPTRCVQVMFMDQLNECLSDQQKLEDELNRLHSTGVAQAAAPGDQQV